LTGRRFHWVILPDRSQSHFCQEGYFLPPSGPKPSFTDPPVDAPLIPLVPPLQLYSVYSESAGLPFRFPDNIAVLLDAFFRLLPDQRKRFLRACYWLQQATCLFLRSFSLSFMAAIAAVETMFEVRDSTPCKECGQKLFDGQSLRGMFVDFLAEHVPLAALTDRGHTYRRPFEQRLKLLYDRRSEITHGTSIMSLDEGRWLMDTIGHQEESDLRTLLRILPLALQDWLLRTLPLESGQGKAET